jgi:hypothetical protein
MSNFIDTKINKKYYSGEMQDCELIHYMYAKGNKLQKENEALKKELEEMKAKYGEK